MNFLSSITITSPAMLVGSAAVMLPIIAHLLNRRARQRIVFPSLMLLEQAAATQSSVFRLRRLILLMLRCAAIVLIAWAFARPVWLSANDAPADASTGLVIVVDASASMAQQSDGLSAMAHARLQAARLLDQLTPGRDVADLVIADARPRSTFENLIANFDALHRDIANLKPTADRADLSAALARAAAILQPHQGPRRVVILSDMQRTNWADLSITPQSDTLRNLEITLIPVQADPSANIAVDPPRIEPAQPIAHQPVRIIAEAVNHSAEPRDVTLSLSIDDQSAGNQRVSLEPWDHRQITFETHLDEAGPHRVAVASHETDALSIDDVGCAVVDAVDRAIVVVIGDDDATQPTGSGFYLQRALSPQGDESDSIRLRHLQSDKVTDVSLRDAQAVFIGDVGAMQPMAMNALLDYMRRGGGVVMFCGPGPVEQNLADLARQSHGTLIPPWQPIQRRADDKPRFFGDGAWSSAPLNVFDETSQFALQRVPLMHTFTLGAIRDEAFTMLRFNDGSPAMSSTNVGAGRLVLANFTPAPAGGDLARRGVFVPLIHGLIDALRPTQQRRPALRVGQTWRRRVDAPGTLAVLDPNHDPMAVQITNIDGRREIITPPLQSQGFYTLTIDNKVTDSCAVRIDPRESDLRRIDSAAARAMFGGDENAVRIHDDHDGAAAIESRGTALWPWLIGAAMALLIAEMILLMVYKR